MGRRDLDCLLGINREGNDSGKELGQHGRAQRPQQTGQLLQLHWYDRKPFKILGWQTPQHVCYPSASRGQGVFKSYLHDCDYGCDGPSLYSGLLRCSLLRNRYTVSQWEGKLLLPSLGNNGTVVNRKSFYEK